MPYGKPAVGASNNQGGANFCDSGGIISCCSSKRGTSKGRREKKLFCCNGDRLLGLSWSLNCLLGSPWWLYQHQLGQ
ncbi:hypothetical protein WG66_000879 [Moniliophthora roreri]|nr:hypothetical protein WG66_000879 [Moniliophthora roreri]